MKEQEAYEDLDHCNPTCKSLEKREMTFTIDLNKGDCLVLYRQHLAQECPGLHQYLNKNQLNFTPGIAGWELPEELVADFWEMLRALRYSINEDLIKRAAQYKTTYIFPTVDGVPLPVPYDVVITDSNGDRVYPGGLAEIGLRLEDAGVSKGILVYGNGPLRKGLKIGEYYTSTNMDGIDLRKMMEATTGLTQGTPLLPFYDRNFNANFISPGDPIGEFIVWKPGALQLHHYVEYGDTSGVMRHQGGDWFKTTLPDPVHGDKFWYDISVTYDPCKRPAEGGMEGAWNISIKAHYDLFVYPPDVYPVGDPNEGVRNVFLFRGIADDRCFKVCEPETGGGGGGGEGGDHGGGIGDGKNGEGVGVPV